MKIVFAWLASLLLSLTAYADEWTGTWTTSLGELRLIEKYGVVYGDYKNVGVIVGVISQDGKRLTGHYTNLTSRVKTGTIVFNKSGATGFGGIYKSSSGNGKWTGTRTKTSLPALQNFGAGNTDAARWKGDFTSTFRPLRLISSGNIVMGDYGDIGVIYGSLANDRLSGYFTNGSNVGQFEWDMRATASSFSGRWKWYGEPSWQSAAWTGKRVSGTVTPLKKLGNDVIYNPRAQTPGPSNYKASDHCGPAFVQEKVPPWLASTVQDAISGDFRNVCREHDACYRAKLKNQKQCDDDMYAGMKAVCNAKPSWYQKQECAVRARALNVGLRSSYGGTAYQGGQIGGIIVSHNPKLIDDTITDDEVEDCVTVKNPTNRTLEYIVRMYTWDMKEVDREPNVTDKNIQAGGTAEFCVGTNFSPRWSKKDLGGNYKIGVFVDDPDSWAVIHDEIMVQKVQYPTP